MPSKYCPDCDKIVCSATSLIFCPYCGKSLLGQKALPEYNTWEEREEILKQARQNAVVKTDAKGQIKLF